MTNEEESRTLAPITEVLPELSAAEYARVREWDAARMALEGEYEAADGEYLIKIRDVLKPRRGLWQRYLEARSIPYNTALDRIHKAENHVVTPRNNTDSVLLREPQKPAYLSAPPVPYAYPEPDDEGSELFSAYSHAVAETPEARSLPMDSFIRKLETLPTVTEDALARWLEIATPADCERVSETLEHVRKWAAHVQQRIALQQQTRLRIIG